MLAETLSVLVGIIIGALVRHFAASWFPSLNGGGPMLDLLRQLLAAETAAAKAGPATAGQAAADAQAAELVKDLVRRRTGVASPTPAGPPQ